MLLRDGREGSTPQEVSNRCGRALTNVRSTSTPAVCGPTMRRCRCRRAAGCRPRLLAIPPF